MLPLSSRERRQPGSTRKVQREDLGFRVECGVFRVKGQLQILLIGVVFSVTVASTLAVVITVIITKYHHSESDEFLNGHKGNHSHDNLRSTSSGDSDYNTCYCLLLLFFEIRPVPLKEGLSACDFRVFGGQGS